MQSTKYVLPIQGFEKYSPSCMKNFVQRIPMQNKNQEMGWDIIDLSTDGQTLSFADLVYW